MPTNQDDLLQWMARSAVTTADGSPKVVFHSTVAEFSAFKVQPGDVGIHFGTAGQAEDRFELKLEHDPYGPQLRGVAHATVAAYLLIENPLRLPDLGIWSARNLADALAHPGQLPQANAHRATSLRSVAQVRAFLRELGYDGIIYRNVNETTGGKHLRERVREAFWQAEPAIRDKTRVTDEEQRHPAYLAYREALHAYKAFREANAEDSYIVFDPRQIRAAIGAALLVA